MPRAADPVTHASPLDQLVDRFDSPVFDVGRPEARIWIEGAEPEPRIVVLEDGRAQLAGADGRADAELIADRQTWESVANDFRDGMAAFRAGRLRIRRDLHHGVGFLAATAPPAGPGRLRLHSVSTAAESISTMEAGGGDPVTLVPAAFARHVEDVLPGASHLELDCGRVPQLERPRETHAAIQRFLAGPEDDR
jgi:hypothetical protein